jgi:hypothetical protein
MFALMLASVTAVVAPLATSPSSSFHSVTPPLVLGCHRVSIPVKDLVQRLSITEDELHKSVEPLLAGKYKVLLKERGASGVPVLSWNIKWTPDKIRISLPHAMVRITRKESEVIKKVVEVDRSVQIDAAIVRIMKMRRRCAHAQLVSEVMAQLVSHFKADPKPVCQRACHRAPRDPQGVAAALCRV